MSEAPPAAILVAPRGATGTLWALLDRLAGHGTEVVLVDELAEAAALAARHAGAPPCLLLDLRAFSSGEPEELVAASEVIGRALQALPACLPIAVTERAVPPLIVACVRAGAADVLDLSLEGTAAVRAVVARVSHEQRRRARERETTASLRALVEDFLRDLIKAERRSLDLEERLARHKRTTGEIAVITNPSALTDERAPVVLLLEPDRALAAALAAQLQTAGVVSFAYASAEDLLYDVDRLLASGTAFDLAVVAAQLPLMDGLEALRELRKRLPALPAFVTSTADGGRVAAEAASLGVVGFVTKPLASVEDAARRVAEQARLALQQARERQYLAAIKERHERVLARYRALHPAE